ncbi:MAG: hypothetical protein KIT60_14010 [Burkholderiaceae bacterium]|nr:hypothetical protein [Burkholderiaceae bacterium]
MVFVLFRSARPSAPQWLGRRWLAALDAVLWPAIWIALVASLPVDGGVVGAVVIGVAALFACERLVRAVLNNERYWFTTWRWGRWVVIALASGLLIKSLLN